MIKLWSVSNFKSIKDKAIIPFAPLTLFVGQNSAGKSTLIQSILLTAQTIQSNALARSVVLNGRIIQLGQFADIRANNSAENKVTIEFELEKSTYGIDDAAVGMRSARYYYSHEYQESMRLVRGSFSFSAGTIGNSNKELQTQPRLEHGSISYQSNEADGNSDFEFKRRDASREDTLRDLDVLQENVRASDPSALDFKVTKSDGQSKDYPRSYRIPTTMKPAGVLLRHFLPIAISATYDAVSEEVDMVFDMLTTCSFDMHPEACLRLHFPACFCLKIFRKYL